MRADIRYYYDHVHHYYGCLGDKPCDHYALPTPLAWEQALLTTCVDVECCDANFVGRNLKDWSELASIVHHFEALIRERWFRMNAMHRKTLISGIWPHLPPHHRPDVDDMVIYACAHQRHTSLLIRYALPHLNLEDLSLPYPMLFLINARSRYAPSTFALSDYEMARMMHLRPALLEPSKSSMAMGDNYGEILRWPPRRTLWLKLGAFGHQTSTALGSESIKTLLRTYAILDMLKRVFTERLWKFAISLQSVPTQEDYHQMRMVPEAARWASRMSWPATKQLGNISPSSKCSEAVGQKVPMYCLTTSRPGLR
jgi:hypothetical protein